jgi:TPR repeat protein
MFPGSMRDAYCKGTSGYPKDMKQCLNWWTKAAKGGHAQAQCRLGDLYFHGRGVQQDKQKGFDLYTLAAQQGNKVAQASLGVMYLSMWKWRAERRE